MEKGKERILLVDDDADLVVIWKRFLEDAGFEVETAGDGGEGLEKALKGGFKLIILDEMMPKVNGIEVLTELGRANPKPDNGPVVVITNLAPDVVAADVVRLGAIGCINKVDLDPGQFVEQVKQFMGRAG